MTPIVLTGVAASSLGCVVVGPDGLPPARTLTGSVARTAPVSLEPVQESSPGAVT